MRGTRTGQSLVSAVSTLPPRPTAYTPTITWPGNTIGTVTAQFLKLPQLLHVWGTFVETAGTALAALTIGLPPGMTISLVTGASSIPCGQLGIVGFQALGAINAGTTVQPQANPISGIVGTWIFQFSVPIV